MDYDYGDFEEVAEPIADANASRAVRFDSLESRTLFSGLSGGLSTTPASFQRDLSYPLSPGNRVNPPVSAPQTQPTPAPAPAPVPVVVPSAAQQPIKISFRPADSAPPAGYLADNGDLYGLHANGYTYGWNVDNTLHVFDRNSALSYSERYDGVAQMQPHGEMARTWQIAVPNGTYDVRVVGGDALAGSNDISLNVEGKPAIIGTTNDRSHWFDNAVTVTVKDGKITINNAPDADGNEINFVEITPTDSSQRMVSALTIPGGDSPSNPAPRHVVQNHTLPNGWQGFVDAVVKPQIAMGYKRFILHNPFGTGPNGEMQLGQYLNAKQAGISWLTDGFAQAFKPVTDAGIEIIAYIGTQMTDPEFMRLLNAGDIAGWNQRFWASVQPLLDAGMSIGFDGAVGVSDFNPLYADAQKLRSMDVNVYVESRPIKYEPYWANFKVISTEADWTRFDPRTHEDAALWAIPQERITGEVVRWQFMPPAGANWNAHGWIVAGTDKILEEGHTAAVPVEYLISNQLTMQGMLAQAGL